MSDLIELSAGLATALVNPAGGRLRSLDIAGFELLVRDPRELYSGSFPMVPWAGRVDRGAFTLAGQQYQLPIRVEPHALHGTGMDQTWTVTARDTRAVTLSVDLRQPVTEYRWPFGGTVEQIIELAEEHLALEMVVTAGDMPMPAMLGWHPWFRRNLTDGAARNALNGAVLNFDATSMYELDETAIPTGRLITPPPGPWDNCFTGLTRGPTIEWPGLLRLSLTSDCDHWVVYDQPTNAVCVEPQTGPPNEFNRAPLVLEPGQQLTGRFELCWQQL